MLDQIWPSVKLSRSGLEEVDVPEIIALGGDQGLMRVEGGIQVRLAWWHHPNDGAQKSDFRTHQLHASDFADVGGPSTWSAKICRSVVAIAPRPTI